MLIQSCTCFIVEVRYGWFKNHNTHNYIFPNHPVHFISQSGYLYFSEVQPTDDRTYYCVVTLVAPHDYDADTTMSPSRVGLGTKLILRPGSEWRKDVIDMFNIFVG
ncbi:hypothetical protein DPMN_166267 [Dreissena polymorpha]|uniref:Ig-like domain-containing protein n=1 Tax=Dreissena polymorpha TaxID=45954 RepID=A0A9D4IU03_DREPO|nr:hypothetical protein DPMN_166267 [Dreissena polymorpha]